MSDSLLCVRDLTLRFGAVTAFAGVSFDVAPGELFAVIGPNGAGKSSLFNALSRVYEPCDGTVTFEGRDFLRLAPLCRRCPTGCRSGSSSPAAWRWSRA
jgi:branched-chain amino acid transport system ATP-binding protein